MRRKALSRRNFLRNMTLGTCGAAIHNALNPGFAVQAFAQSHSRAVIDGAHLFVINLAGGCSYNIAPIYASAWRDRNPTISYGPGESLPLASGSDQGFHPSLSYFKTLFDNGELALMNEVAFSQRASRSHDVASQMWMTGSIDPNGKSGVLNALACRVGGSGLIKGMSFAGADPIVEGGCAEMRKLEGLSSLQGQQLQYSDDETEWLHLNRTNLDVQSSAAPNQTRTYVKNAIGNMDASAQQIQDTLAGNNLPNVGVNPPNGGFGTDIRDAMRVLQASDILGTKIFYLETGGFDTHSNERNSLPGRLAPLNQGVQYIAEISKALGLWDRTIIMVFSEFARTFENGSNGTDHGEVAPLMIMGGRVNGRQVNPAPSATKILSSGSFMRNP
ncbi:MAG: DUF1501 domain-containing protein, partial [Bdellovibrionales bacterium]|nr:DUF1501 domain-containing protein [Bdellovibrionales bacterium]